MAQREFRGNWRLILRLDDEAGARAFLSELSRALRLEFDITVCEPFSEAPGRYDCVFVTRHAFSDDEQLIAALRSYCRMLPGDWTVEELQCFEHGVRSVQASTQTVAQPLGTTIEWGHCWIGNQEILTSV